MENFMHYITENSLILIPVLCILGMIIKETMLIPERYIPVVILPIGIVFALFVSGFNVNGVIDGILVTGAAVYVNHLVIKRQTNNNNNNDKPLE